MVQRLNATDDELFSPRGDIAVLTKLSRRVPSFGDVKLWWQCFLDGRAFRGRRCLIARDSKLVFLLFFLSSSAVCILKS
jgi:hypothetical protein